MDGIIAFWTDIGNKFYQAFFYADRWQLYLSGLGQTLSITAGAICISTLLGMVLCLMKLSKHRILRAPAQAYIDVIRGIPVMVQLLIIYFVILSSWTNKLAVAIIAFAINSTAYVAEIFRSGIASVDQGQMEAGRSLGLSRFQTMRFIIFPQGIKNCLPTYASEFIVLVKETAVVGYIGMQDLTKAYSIVQSRTMDAMAPLLIIAVIYFIITTTLSKLFAAMERRLRASDQR
ncbi:MAG: amino acid ABC transporter permease [Oscillibacter sp.]